MAREIREKSQIDSFDVSLGPSLSPRSPQTQLEKWNILVCSDLGFATQKPHTASVAEWNEFMAAQNIVLSGTIQDASFNGGAPLFVEIPVRSMKDFSRESIAASVAPMSGLSKTVFGLEQLLDGKASPADVLSLITKTGLSVSEESRIAALLDPRPGVARTKPQAKRENSPIDNILSMVDSTSPSGDVPSSTGDGPAEDAGTGASRDGPGAVTDALFQSVAGSGESGPDKAAIRAMVAELRARLDRMTDTVISQPFFASRKASWNCLLTLAKVVGRKKEVIVRVVSSSQADAEENLGGVLSSCLESGAAADIAVWDYDVSFSNAHMNVMARAAAAADRYKCVIVAPLAMDDPLLSGISGRDTIAHFFDEVRFLAFKKLRTDPASRCLCLCGPGLSLPRQRATQGGRCCWFVATRWAEMLLSENNPFGAFGPRPPVDSALPQDDVFCGDVAPSAVSDACRMGLTLFERSLRNASLDKAVTVVGGEAAAESYSSLLFNLVVNRAIRLAGIRLLAKGPQAGRAEVASDLEQFLRAELSAYGVVSADKQVAATAGEDGKINVVVDSDATVSGYRVGFTFSF
jgi:hypothetical protein